jgi:hypothetical protein
MCERKQVNLAAQVTWHLAKQVLLYFTYNYVCPHMVGQSYLLREETAGIEDRVLRHTCYMEVTCNLRTHTEDRIHGNWRVNNIVNRVHVIMKC